MLKGAFSALVTPFKNGAVDEEKYREFIEWQIQEGIDGLVPCGTTGESATLSHEEHEKVIRICIDQAKKRVPVIAGAGANNTSEAVSLTKFAKSAGADAVLHITPYYNKPTQEGIIAHFKAIAKEVSIPIIVYNVPGRTGLNVLPATMGRLYKEIPDVVGCKEATGNLTQISEIFEQVDDKFSLLSGDDFTLLPTMALGGTGVISVASNIVPKDYHDLCAAMLKGDLEAAKKVHFKVAELCRVCFVETNPVPVKTAVALMGKMAADVRLPLVSLQPKSEEIVKAALKNLKLV